MFWGRKNQNMDVSHLFDGASCVSRMTRTFLYFFCKTPSWKMTSVTTSKSSVRYGFHSFPVSLSNGPYFTVIIAVPPGPPTMLTSVTIISPRSSNNMIASFNVATNQLHGRIDGFADRLDGLVLDASPDLFTVTTKGNFAQTVRVERHDIEMREGEIITGGYVYAGSMYIWDGHVFKNTYGNVLAFGRDAAVHNDTTINWFAPSDAWILIDGNNATPYMSVGPSTDLPAPVDSSYYYQTKWRWDFTKWIPVTSSGINVYDSVAHETGPVTNNVNFRFEHVATRSTSRPGFSGRSARRATWRSRGAATTTPCAPNARSRGVA